MDLKPFAHPTQTSSVGRDNLSQGCRSHIEQVIRTDADAAHQQGVKVANVFQIAALLREV